MLLERETSYYTSPGGNFKILSTVWKKELKFKVKGLGPAVLHVYRNQTFTLKSTGEIRKGALCTSGPPVLEQQEQLTTEWVTPDIGEIAGDDSRSKSRSRSRSKKRSKIRRRSKSRSKSRSRSKNQQDPRPCLSVVKRSSQNETSRLGLLLSQKTEQLLSGNAPVSDENHSQECVDQSDLLSKANNFRLTQNAPEEHDCLTENAPFSQREGATHCFDNSNLPQTDMGLGSHRPLGCKRPSTNLWWELALTIGYIQNQGRKRKAIALILQCFSVVVTPLASASS